MPIEPNLDLRMPIEANVDLRMPIEANVVDLMRPSGNLCQGMHAY